MEVNGTLTTLTIAKSKGASYCLYCTNRFIFGSEEYRLTIRLDNGKYTGCLCCPGCFSQLAPLFDERIKSMNKEEILKFLHDNPVNKFADTPANVEWDFTHSQLVDVPIIIVAGQQIETQFGVAILATCVMPNEDIVSVLLCGQVLIDQYRKFEACLPVRTTIVKNKTYYQFA